MKKLFFAEKIEDIDRSYIDGRVVSFSRGFEVNFLYLREYFYTSHTIFFTFSRARART